MNAHSDNVFSSFLFYFMARLKKRAFFIDRKPFLGGVIPRFCPGRIRVLRTGGDSIGLLAGTVTERGTPFLLYFRFTILLDGIVLL